MSVTCRIDRGWAVVEGNSEEREKKEKKSIKRSKSKKGNRNSNKRQASFKLLYHENKQQE